MVFLPLSMAIQVSKKYYYWKLRNRLKIETKFSKWYSKFLLIFCQINLVIFFESCLTNREDDWENGRKMRRNLEYIFKSFARFTISFVIRIPKLNRVNENTRWIQIHSDIFNTSISVRVQNSLFRSQKLGEIKIILEYSSLTRFTRHV